jgi:phosphoribosyl-ATP pyrophosphohydrolase/phosphoribosyl-AMP cyclohydrolase
MKSLDKIKYNEKGLVPVITQDFESGKVLMMAYAKKEQLEKTLDTGLAFYFSRSRDSEWLKGDTSGHYQKIVEVRVDCDMDVVLYIVRQVGAACHTGEFSCFYRQISEKGELDDE